MNIGKNETDEALNEVLKTLAINECCTLVFTVINIIFSINYLLVKLINNILFELVRNSGISEGGHA